MMTNILSQNYTKETAPGGSYIFKIILGHFNASFNIQTIATPPFDLAVTKSNSVHEVEQ